VPLIVITDSTLKIKDAVLSRLQRATDATSLDVVELLGQRICREPSNLGGLLISHLRLTGEVAATKAHRYELARVAVGIDNIGIGGEQGQALNLRSDSSLLEQLPQRGTGRLLKRLNDSGWQAPAPGVSALCEENMEAAGFPISPDNDYRYCGQQQPAASVRAPNSGDVIRDRHHKTLAASQIARGQSPPPQSQTA
jgi:hypothetical protein